LPFKEHCLYSSSLRLPLLLLLLLVLLLVLLLSQPPCLQEPLQH